MAARRYTITIADQTSGVVHRTTIPVRPIAIAGCVVLAIPVLIGVGAAWKAKSDVAGLIASHQALEQENANFRTATESLAGQITSLQAAIADLGARSALDPALAKAMDKLPAIVKSRAIGGGKGGGTEVDKAARATLSSLVVPDDTFGLLRTLLEGLESRLQGVRASVDRRNALAAATPSIWPARGWLTSTMGKRPDPISGDEDFHAGLDIAGDKGQPVYATAAGVVTGLGYRGAYGNLITVDHGFGLQTRYGHLLDYSVRNGQQVKRGDVIGHVGATGRATGYHLHYEVLASGKLLNPLQLLTQQRPRAQ
ncbi:MAG: M23 family metallopeptidase [Vicinamibacterales bacterium]